MKGDMQCQCKSVKKKVAMEKDRKREQTHMQKGRKFTSQAQSLSQSHDKRDAKP